MKKMMGAAALCVAAVSGEAETIEFEADQGVVFARCAPWILDDTDAVCEAVFPADTEEDSYSCVVLDNKGKPIASKYGPDDYLDGGIHFNGLDYTLAADMKCRKR
jgi:hypothetical protein